MNTITTISPLSLNKLEKRRETFRKASKKYLDRDNNRQQQRIRCLNNYYYKKEIKRLSEICY